MGSRASYIIKKNNSYDIYYHHWGAQRIPEDLFFGPEPSLTFITSLEKKDEILDDLWGEGAVYLDLDTRKLLLFGGQSILWSNSLKRLYMALLRRSWRGWSVFWAKHEMYDFAQIIQYPLEKVLTSDFPYDEPVAIQDIETSSEYDGAVTTIKKNNSLQHYEMDLRADDLLLLGPSKLFQAFESLEHGTMKPETREHEYDSFLFIDADGQQLFYDNEFERDFRQERMIVNMWPGWSVTEHNQGIYKHALLCGFYWKDYVMDEEILVNDLKGILLNVHQDDPVDTIQALTDRGLHVEVLTPSFFQNQRPLFAPLSKEKYFDDMVKIWKDEDNYYQKTFEVNIW